MKVLFWVSPITEMSWPFQKTAWLQSFVPRTLEQLKKSFPVEDIVLCVSDDLHRHIQDIGCSLDGRIVTFSQVELLDGFSYDALKERKRYQATGEYTSFYHHLDDVYLRNVGNDFIPDIIISFNESPFLRRRFPDAAHLTIELSVFSRQPYPELFAFDPLSDGNGCRFTTAKYAGLINEVSASQEERDALERYKKAIVASLTGNAYVSKYFSGLRSRFKHILLMPLGYENYFDTLVSRPYSGQFEFVEHALSSIDQNTCLILTQHPTIHAIRPERIEELKEIYPNLLCEDWYGSVPGFSQVAIAYADGCIVGGSSLAYQAAFLGKYLISPDGFCAGIADATDLASIEHIFDKDPLPRDNYFVWVLRHLSVEMLDAWRFFNAVIPERKKWASLSPEAMLKCWPALITTPEFVEKLRCWELGPAANFQGQLAGIMPCSVTRDGSSLTLKYERDAAVAERGAAVAERDAAVAERDAAVAERDAVIDSLNGILRSHCWRWTKPCRWLMDFAKRMRHDGF